MARGSLRIYWGEWRVTIDADDPRAAKILALVEPDTSESPPLPDPLVERALETLVEAAEAYLHRADLPKGTPLQIAVATGRQALTLAARARRVRSGR